MKNTFKFVLLASLVVFAAACGKKDESSSSSGFRSSLSTGSNISTSSRQAVEQFNRWYASRFEPSVTPGVYRVAYTSASAQNSNSNCEERDLGFLGLKYWYCAPSTSGSLTSGLDECRTTIIASDRSVKGENASLARIAAGQAGTLVNATFQGSSENYQNSVFTLQFQKSNAHIVTYIIDTRYHSAMQPVQVTDTESDSLMYYYGSAISTPFNTVSVAGLEICD